MREKIIFIGFYEPKEAIISINEELKNRNYEVRNYPLFKKTYDKHDKIENVKEDLDEYIKREEAEYILWWFIDVEVEIFKYIRERNPKKIIIIVNTDEPINYSEELKKKIEICDILYITSTKNIKEYKKINKKAIIEYMPVGYDEKKFYPKNDVEDKYKSDISIMCRNIMEKKDFPEQYIERKKMIEKIIEYCEKNNKKFNIYGPILLRDTYPENYKGEIEYEKQNEIINGSKINLVTHSSYKDDKAITEFEMKILGCKKILLTEPMKGYDEIIKNGYITYNENYIEIIDEILKNYEKYDKVREKGYEKSKNYTWRKIIEKIDMSIKRRVFDSEFYKKYYKLEETDEKRLWEHYKKIGKEKGYIIKRPIIPKKFNHKKYKEENNKKTDNIIELYLEWQKDTNKERYIDDTSQVLNKEYNTTKREIIRIMNIMEKIEDKENIEELKKIIERNPKIKIMEIINDYLKIIEE